MNAVVGVSEAFRSAIASRGITPPSGIIPDGKIHRYASNGDRDDDAGWYVFYSNDPPAGAFGCWRSGVSETWCARHPAMMSEQERTVYRRRIDELNRQREIERRDRHTQAAERAQTLWNSGAPVDEGHGYLCEKKVTAHGLRLSTSGSLMVPIYNADGAIISLQFISSTGDKKFLAGGATAGGFFLLGDPYKVGPLCLAEGFATAASIIEATGFPTVVVFSASNIMPVARGWRVSFPDRQIIICADDDSETPGNPGLTKATEAANAIAGVVVVPDFGADRPENMTDFNDLMRLRGPDTVTAQIQAARTQWQILERSESWPEALPLVATVEAEPYPVDALPEGIRQAVEEVAAFVKAPVAMVASSALAALALAAQARIDVKRADRLTGPVGLFFLTIADSGERKSTCDGFFSEPIREYDRTQAENAKPGLKDYAAAYAGWAAERDGILTAIKQASKSGKSPDDFKRKLSGIESSQPAPPRVPRLLHGDDTPEHLAYALARQYPSAGVLTAEAGLVFGSHGMGTDSVMRNLALLNTLWDGGTHQVGRRTSESFTVRGARLTMGLQVQEATLRSFFQRSGGLARGTGFLARFLMAWPESTQGHRPFTESPETWPALDSFHQRILAILNELPEIDEAGALTPTLVSLTPEAKAAWVVFHDAIEEKLGTGGELNEVRDVASKIADNAARLAALFQSYCSNCSSSNVPVDKIEAACRIVAWHLNESRRFFGELALPPELADPARLEAWLIKYCHQEHANHVPMRVLQQYGPGGLRRKRPLMAVLHQLGRLHRLRLLEKEGSTVIEMNPVLLLGGDK